METAFKVLGLLPWTDWAAVAVFFVGWVGCCGDSCQAAQRAAAFAAGHHQPDPPPLDAAVDLPRGARGRRHRHPEPVQQPSFFASTTILIIGGLLAVLGTTEKASELVREIPFAARTTSVLVFDLKIVLLLGIFVYAFSASPGRCASTPSARWLVGALPERDDLLAMGDAAAPIREAFAERAGRVVGLAAETFNDGLRYYFAFAAIGWFFSPLALAVATVGVVFILYRREFRSGEVLKVASPNSVPLRSLPRMAATELVSPKLARYARRPRLYCAARRLPGYAAAPATEPSVTQTGGHYVGSAEAERVLPRRSMRRRVLRQVDSIPEPLP